MKPLALVVLVLTVLGVTTAWAQVASAPPGLFRNATIEQTEKSLVQALESGIPGMEVSAALTVWQLKKLMPDRSFSCFIIPLMRVLKREDAGRCSRVVAAIALHELHSARGDYAIAQEGEITGCDRLANTCRWLTYYQYLEDHPDVATRDSAGFADGSIYPIGK